MSDGQVVWLFLFIGLVAYVAYRQRQRVSSAYGTAQWASDWMLRRAGMLGGKGLVLGRTVGGRLIHLAQYCHVLIIGSPGTGKGVSLIIPNLLNYNRGSVFCFDTKGDLYKATADRRRHMGQKVVLLAPFKGEGGCNPFDVIPADSPLLVDSARAMAEALVVRTGMEHEPHFNDRGAMVITGASVLVLLKFKKEDRNLSTVQDIISDPPVLYAAANRLCAIGGIPGRYGAQIRSLFAKEGEAVMPTREGFSVLSTAQRHLSFLDSEAVAKFVGTSTVDIMEMLTNRLSVYVQIPPDQLEAQKGLLRCLTSTFIRVLGAMGDENKNEMLFMIDEASALGSLMALKEGLVRGRSAGMRFFLAYQSCAQVEAAFPQEKTLLFDNCSTHIFLGAASYETAERVSLSLGEYSQAINSRGENWGQSRSENRGEGQSSTGNSSNYSEIARRLMKPEEILSMDPNYMIAFVRGMAPIWVKRIKWYAEWEFNPAVKRPWSRRWIWIAAVVLAAAGLLWMKLKGGE